MDPHKPSTGGAEAPPGRRLRLVPLMGLTFLVAVLATAGVTYVLVTMFEHRQEARTPFVRLVEVSEITTDPVPWGKNWPQQFDGWKSTAGDKFYGGSSALPASKLERQPWLKRLYAGYAFSIDYREARGHAYMLYDQGVTERVTKKPQAGACLHCHASTTVLYRRIGLEALGRPADDAALSRDFDMPAVMRGFEELSLLPYHDVLAKLVATPDGTPQDAKTVFPMPPAGGFTGELAGEPVATSQATVGHAHPVTCIDCHDPESMGIRVTRPGFMRGIAALAEGDAPAPHLPSIERWRRSGRQRPYDPNLDATRQELRSFVCGQCHVEYYCASRMTLTFPWGNGLQAENIEQYWDETRFPDGTEFYDFEHAEMGAPVYKVQHPEFELWSQGVHARSGVSCADCHMPYTRSGAMKISSHNVRSPLESINHACQQCHHFPESELRQRVATIQEKTIAMTERAAQAMLDMLDAIAEARAAGVADDRLAEALRLGRKAMWRLDFISSENSDGFHADQEAMRILAESIDFSRQAQALALRARTTDAPSAHAPPAGLLRGSAHPADAPAARVD